MSLLPEWKPYCFERKCTDIHTKRRPTHGPCCTCQECGQAHDECVCQYFKEPCMSCQYKNK